MQPRHHKLKKKKNILMSNKKEKTMKMINTLVAVVIAIAIVGNVDARVRQSVKTGTPAKQSATNLLEAAKNAEVNPTATSKSDLAATMSEEANTPEKMATLELRAQEKRLLDGIKLVNERMKDINYSWYSFFASQDTKKAHAAASDRLRELNNELKDVQAQLKDNEKEVGKPWSMTAKYAVGVAIVTGIAGVVADVYYGTGYTAKGMEMGKAAGSYVSTKASEAGTYMSNKASNARGAMGTTYRKYAPKRLGGE
jgi:hypothetical protein